VALKRFRAEAELQHALFGREDLPDWAAVRARLGEVTLEEDLAAATVVGEGLGADPNSLVRAYEAARRAGVEVTGCDASPLRLTLYGAPARLDDLVRALHAEFLVSV
jgi:aspartokinase